MKDYTDIWFTSNDGLTLYARDYNLCDSGSTVVCIPGLTRNSSDFTDLAEHLCTRYRVISIDLRGRGRSDYDANPENYHPRTYVEDVMILLDTLGLDSFSLIGSSLGGLISMFIAAMMPSRVSAVVLNDIGPAVNPVGLERIRSYVGGCVGDSIEVASWREAIEKTQSIHGSVFPDFEAADWLAFTKNLYREDDQGKPIQGYDPAIAVLMNQDPDSTAPPELWSVFELINDIPLLLVRGKLSDILSEETVSKMLKIKPKMQRVDVENRGHAPLLSEPICLESIDRLLDSANSGK